MGDVPPWIYDRALKIPIYNLYHINRAKAVCKAILNALNPTPQTTLADVGCNGGTLTELITKCTGLTRVIGVDIDEEFLEYAETTRKRFEKIVADAKSLPFRDNSIDVVTIIEVLEHIDEPETALREAYRVLKQNGTLISMVPSDESKLFKTMWSMWVSTFGKHWKGKHVNSFDTNSLINIIKRSGFEIASIKRINLNMLTLVVARKRR